MREATPIKELRLDIEEFVSPQTFSLEPIKDALRYHGRTDILLCLCNPPLVLPGKFTPSGDDEGSTLIGLVDRFVEGSLLGDDRLPAMVNVLWTTQDTDPNIGELTDENAVFAYTGVLRKRL